MAPQIEISRLTEEDIPGAIEAIQQAFAEDPYNRWIYNVREKVRQLLCVLGCFDMPILFFMRLSWAGTDTLGHFTISTLFSLWRARGILNMPYSEARCR
jgi:hypothetical protein